MNPAIQDESWLGGSVVRWFVGSVVQWVVLCCFAGSVGAVTARVSLICIPQLTGVFI